MSHAHYTTIPDTIYTLSRKKEQNVFCNISYKTLVILMKFNTIS